MSTHTTGTFTYRDWQEAQAEGAPRIGQAKVSNSFTGGITAAETACAYTIAYLTETTGTFAGMEIVDGTLDGRKGGFVCEQHGTFDDAGTVHCRFSVVPGSGTGELAGLRGSGSFVARHGESTYPYTFDYELGEE